MARISREPNQDQNKTMKRKELFLMLVPCLLLIVGGWYFSRRNPSTHDNYNSGPFRTVATKIEVLPASAREVSEGFDRKVEATVTNAGVPVLPLGAQLLPTPGTSFSGPQNVQLFQGDSPQPLQVPPGSLRKLGIHGNEQKSVVRLNLSKIPVGKGDLVLKMQSQIDSGYAISIKGKKRYVPLRSQPADISVVVRRADEKVTAPLVSRVNPFIVERAELEDATHHSFPQDPYMYGDVILTLHRAPLPQMGDKKPVMAFYDTYLEDESGKKYRFLRRNKKYDSFNPAFIENDITGRSKNTFDLRLSQIPPKAGQLTFKTKISVDNCWPREISVLLRNRGASYSYAINQKQPVVLANCDVRLKQDQIP